MSSMLDDDLAVERTEVVAHTHALDDGSLEALCDAGTNVLHELAAVLQVRRELLFLQNPTVLDRLG